MAKRPPIPIPLGQHWREFRRTGVPLIVFAATVTATTILWRGTVGPPTIRGEVQQVQSWVSSSRPGMLVELKVSLFDVVQAGTPIAVVKPPHDPRTALTVLGEDLDILRMQVDPSFQRLRLDLQSQKVALATARSNLRFADIELQRTEKLFSQKMATAVAYDLLRKNKEALEKDVEERSRLVTDMEKEIGLLRGTTAGATGEGAEDPLQEALQSHREKLREIEAEVDLLTLTAPIDGTVTAISRRQGENVVEGEPIVIISATRSDHVMGYLRQPVHVEPIIGMPVAIRTSRLNHQSLGGEVVSIGAQFVPIPATLLNPVVTQTVVELGLPIQVSLPADLNVRPGEIVELTLQKKL